MELLLINHPLDCPVCDKGGECPLQNQAMSNGRSTSRFEDVKRTYPKPINISAQVLLDRERCVLCARCTRFSEQIAGDPFIALVERGALQQVGIYEDQPFESLLLRQHRADLPGGRPHRRGVPLPVPPVRPGVDPERLRALRQRLRDPHRPPPRHGAAPDGAERPGGQRGVELRQGPLGLRLHLGRRPPRAAAWCAATTASCASASWREALEAAAAGLRAAKCRRRARRRPGQRRGRLRLRQVRPHRARHQRRRLPRPAALRRGGRLPRPTVVATGPDGGAVTYADLEAAGTVLLVGLEPEDESPIVFLRLRKASASTKHRRVCRGARSRPAASPSWAARSSRPLPAPRPRCCAPSPRAPAPTSSPPPARRLRDNAVVLVGERLATVPGALTRGRRPRRGHRRPARLGARGGPASAVRSRPARSPTLLPGGRPVGGCRGPRRGRRRLGRRRRCPTRAGRDTAGILAAAGIRRASTRSSSAASTRPTSAHAGADDALATPVRRLARDPPLRGHRGRRRRAARRAARREGRHLRRLGGPGPRLPGGPRHQRDERPPRPRHAGRRAGRLPRAPARCARSAPRCRHSARGRRPRRGRPGRRRPATPERRSPAPLVLATWRHLLDRGSPAGRRAVPRGHRARPRRPAVRDRPPSDLGVVDGDARDRVERRRRDRHRAGAGDRRWSTTSSGCRPTRWAAPCAPRCVPGPARRSTPARRPCVRPSPTGQRDRCMSAPLRRRRTAA